MDGILSHPPLTTFQLTVETHTQSLVNTGCEFSYVTALTFPFPLFFKPETWLTKLSTKLG
jgi:hypothetical protein